MKTALLMIPFLMLTTLAAPASASHVVYEECGTAVIPSCSPDEQECTLLGTPTGFCSGEIQLHFAWSDPSIHCNGSAGSYTSCSVYHECTWAVSGVLAFGVMDCTGAAADTWTGTGGERNRGTSASVVILNGSCADLTMNIQVTSTLGGSASLSHTWRICVDGTGPFHDS